jgi:hypothetical protein
MMSAGVDDADGEDIHFSLRILQTSKAEEEGESETLRRC